MVMKGLTSAGRNVALKRIEQSIEMAFKTGRIERLPDNNFNYLSKDGMLLKMTLDELAAHVWSKANENAGAASAAAVGAPMITLAYFDITPDNVKEILVKRNVIDTTATKKQQKLLGIGGIMGKFTQGLTASDVEAIAKSRVSQIKRKTTMYWMVGCLIVAAVGIFLKTQPIVGFGLMIVAIAAFLYYLNTLSKLQNIEKTYLLKLWNEERESAPSPDKVPAPGN